MKDEYWIPEYDGPREGWRVPRPPVAHVIGRGRDEVVALYRSDGFSVEVFEHGVNGGWNADLSPERIRLYVRDDTVMNAGQG